MNWFKSIWMKLRKSNGLPGNEVLVPMVEQKVPEVVTKPKRTRKKKETKDGTS